MTRNKTDVDGESPATDGSGVLMSIAMRPASRDPMIEVEACEVRAGRGLVGESRPPGNREVTLLSVQAWNDVCRELKTDLPWITRRANLFIDGIDLAATLGQTIVVGKVRIQAHGESKPCALMDELHAGLREALVPNGRGGVAGRVLAAGTIHVGDAVEVLA